MRRLLLGMAIAATAALLPAVSQADDHQIAEFIKSRLQVEQQRGNLRGFNVDMRVDKGTVWFKGHVSDAEQERLILSTAQKAGYLGVVQVVDDIEIQGASATPAQQASVQLAPMTQEAGRNEAYYNQAASYQEPTNYFPPQQTQMPMASQNVYSNGAPLPFAQASPASMGQVPAQQMSGPMTPPMMGSMGPGMPPGMAQPGMGPMGPPPGPMGPAAGAPMGMGGPAPIGMGGDAMSGNPNLPGYAWPGYAASPNYGALTYPKQYSASAWPYIGPFYPYPQVPLGWRKVSLEWDDGWWFLDFHDR
jgi:hypothetical protein